MKRILFIAILIVLSVAVKAQPWKYTPKVQADSMNVYTYFKLNNEVVKFISPTDDQYLVRKLVAGKHIWTNVTANSLGYDSIRFDTATGNLRGYKNGSSNAASTANLNGRYTIIQTFHDSIAALRALIPVNTVTPGTKTKITYNLKGLVTSGTDATATDITNTPAGNLSSINVGSALNELDSEKVPYTVLYDENDPTGFLNGSSIAINYDHTSRTVTLTGDLTYYWRGIKHTLTSPWTSSAHTATVGKWYLYSNDGVNFNWSQSVWQFTDIQVMALNYRTTASQIIAIRETHGLMPWQDHEIVHNQLGTYLKSGGQATSGTFTLNTALDAATTPGFDAFVLKDEDNESSEPAWTEGTYTTMYVGSGNTSVFNVSSSFPFISSGSYIQYNTPADGSFTTGVGNKFYNVYAILLPVTASVNSQRYRVIMLQPQAEYSSEATAIAESITSLNLGEISSYSPEFKIFARLTYSSASSNSNTGKVQLSNITYILGTNSNTVNVPLASSNHASLSNIAWTSSGHTGANNTIAGFNGSGLAETLTKNTGFNLNLGTTTGTVLEGRTFGTAANSATTDFAASSHTHAISNITNLQTSLDGKQATLVSGTNIKTVNGSSLLGSGNLTISGGGGIALSDLSATSPISYNNTTGVFSMVSNAYAPYGTVSFPGFGTNHTTAAYGDHTHTGTYELPLTFSTGLSRVGNTISSTITQYTDALARGSISLTTTGSSGAATYNSTTGVLNIPQYISGVGGGYTDFSATFNNSGSGDVSGTTFNGSAAKTISYNTVGAAALAGSLSQPFSANSLNVTNGIAMGSAGLTIGTKRISLSGNTMYFGNIDGSLNMTFDTSTGTLYAPNFSGGAGTGTVTSVGMTVPTGLTVTGIPITTSGTLALSLTTGYTIPTITQRDNWNTAYGWGNHAGLYVPIANDGKVKLFGISTYGELSSSYFEWNTNSFRIKRDGSPQLNGLLPITSGGVYDALLLKQDNLVSGTTIKTINGTSILGSGNLSTATAWGGITGTLSNQTDLQNALNAKANINGSSTQDFLTSTLILGTSFNSGWSMQGSGLTFSAFYNGSSKFTIDNSGNVTAYNFTGSSDKRLKKDIQKIQPNQVSKIKFKQFRFKDNPDKLRYGVIAQQVEKYMPELVYTDEKGMKSVAYIDLLIAKIADLEARIKQLEQNTIKRDINIPSTKNMIKNEE